MPFELNYTRELGLLAIRAVTSVTWVVCRQAGRPSSRGLSVVRVKSLYLQPSAVPTSSREHHSVWNVWASRAFRQALGPLWSSSARTRLLVFRPVRGMRWSSCASRTSRCARAPGRPWSSHLGLRSSLRMDHCCTASDCAGLARGIGSPPAVHMAVNVSIATCVQMGRSRLAGRRRTRGCTRWRLSGGNPARSPQRCGRERVRRSPLSCDRGLCGGRSVARRSFVVRGISAVMCPSLPFAAAVRDLLQGVGLQERTRPTSGRSKERRLGENSHRNSSLDGH
mmetsp:Transcript_39719/g.105143  ORF Transcript_39719/g.105143 Transcript_39719/m.105143 type:complete len:281 (-) Transcript_39719:51-893(-)